MSATKKLTFLFNTFDAFGTVNPMLEMAKCLKSRGHTIVFLSIDAFRKTIEDCDFIYEQKRNITENVNECVQSNSLLNAVSSRDSLKIMIQMKMSSRIIRLHHKREINLISKCIAEHSVDIIVLNSTLGSVEAVYSGKPWVGVYFQSPLDVYNYYDSDHVLPPYMSGFETDGHNDSGELAAYKVQKNVYDKEKRKVLNASYAEHLFPTIDANFPISPYLNIYSYPKELDYSHIVELPQNNWFRVDSYLCNQSGCEFVLPKQFKNRSGKLIYISMGYAALNLEFMRKLVAILSKCSHRFVVSKGARSSEYELADNMCCAGNWTQTAILSKVDLFITHGDNNSIAEAFFYGKPMIVMPFINDQYDNAQRIAETGYGIRLNAQLFTENELLSSIDTLLDDNDLRIRMKSASERIQSDNSLEEAVNRIENLKYAIV